MKDILTAVLLTAISWKLVENNGYYYMNRYPGEISYTTEEIQTGLYDFELGYVNITDTETQTFLGCLNTTYVAIRPICDGTKIFLDNLEMVNMTKRNFINNYTESISILNCPFLKLFENDTFDHLVSLRMLRIQKTALNHVPEVSRLNLVVLHLAGNQIKMDTHNFSTWNLPSTLECLSLANNSLHWIPPNSISGSNLRVVSLSYNKLIEIHPNIFGDVPALKYLGMDGNQIETITKNTLAPINGLDFNHLNLSNNHIRFIQGGVFNHMNTLHILELHNNHLKRINPGMLHNLDKLLHLDLHGNRIEYLGSMSFKNLEELRELRLHSQQPPMRTIAYDAWENIDDNLRELFVSSNMLRSFPHPVLQQGYYPNLREMHADNNKIKNATLYSATAFPQQMLSIHRDRERRFTPFSTTPNLMLLDVSANRLTHVTRSDFCPLDLLKYLHLEYNYIRDNYIDDDAFACLDTLTYINLFDNRIQYVPTCFDAAWKVPNLCHLELGSNHITFVAKGSFSNIPTLKVLYMHENVIRVVENGSFPVGIDYINVDHNRISFTHSGPFQHLPLLRDLHLSENRIGHIPLNAFDGCRSLLKLELQKNKIPELRVGHLEGLMALEVLYIHSNILGWIEHGAFAKLRNLVNVTMYSNYLARIPMEGSFSNRRMDRVELYQNRITTISTGTFKDLICEEINLNKNSIYRIETRAFVGLVVKEVDISSNPLRQLHAHSFSGMTVENMRLSPGHLTTIPTMAFSDVSAKSIDLSHNEITTLEQSAFYDVDITDMNLAYNRLTTISKKVFGGHSRVNSSLQLQGNFIEHIEHNAFENLKVSTLNLGNNMLRDIPRAISNTHIKELDLGANQIPVLPPQSFSGLFSLEKLNLENNNIKNIELGVFDDLLKVKVLDLSHNKLQTLPLGLFDPLISIVSLSLVGNQMTHIHKMSNPGLEHINAVDNNIGTVDIDAFSELRAYRRRINLDRNPLQCTCEFMHSVVDVPGLMSRGTCAQNTNVKGTKLHPTLLRWYPLVNPTSFLCSADDISGTVLSATHIQVQWNHPSNVYKTMRRARGGSTQTRQRKIPKLEGSILYTVTCFNANGKTVVKSIRSFVGAKSETNATMNTSNRNSELFKSKTYSNATDLSLNATNDITSNVTVNDSSNSSIEKMSLSFTKDDGVLPGTKYECSVTRTNNVSSSARSTPVVLTTPQRSERDAPDIANYTGVELAITYHDFSTNITDFDNLEYIPYRNVTYVASPFGAWLSAPETPNNSTFASWFKENSELNVEIEDVIVLRNVSETELRYWSDAFFPVDRQGFWSDRQRDCDGTYHNFGFTSVIRTGFIFGGQEVITVAGGDGLWVFINKIKLVEYTSTGLETIPCYLIDLSPAVNPGGIVSIQMGILINGGCTSLSQLTDGVSVDLRLNQTYHLDIFQAETKTCTSEFLLILENVTLQHTQLALPLDYIVYVPEDLEIGNKVSLLTLTDSFSSDMFNVILYADRSLYNVDKNEADKLCCDMTSLVIWFLHTGNEQRRFNIVDTEPSPSSKRSTPEFVELLDIHGNIVRFVDCPKPKKTLLENMTLRDKTTLSNTTTLVDNTTLADNTTLSDNTTVADNTTVLANTSLGDNTTLDNMALPDDITESYRTYGASFTFNSTPVVVVLADELDFENIKEYNLLFEVVDLNTSVTGYFYLQIQLLDVNDNCPVIMTMDTFMPRPVLRKGPLLKLGSTDADSGRNADIHYVMSAIKEDPPVTYDRTFDLFKHIYTNYTTIALDIIAVDNGTVPRGTTVTFNLSISNSCILDVKFKKTDLRFHFNDTNNKLWLTLPGYYLANYECEELAGISTGYVPDNWMSASSSYDFHLTSPWLARLHLQPNTYNGLAGGWVAGVLDTNQYLQVDMDKVCRFRKVHIQGRAEADEWVASYTIWYDVGNNTWVQYTHSNGSQVFTGNIDRTTIVTHLLDPDIVAQKIRLNPQSWNVRIAMRVEFTGCIEEKKIYFDTHCMRCETSYFCLGDGERHTCGRCENETATCHRDPTEHSFGTASRCWPCPTGWLCKNGTALPCGRLHYATCDNGSCPEKCTHCEEGFSCNNGTRTICQPGTYSDGNMDACTRCRPGTYQDQYAQGTCKQCSPGHYAWYGKATCSTCPRANYVSRNTCAQCKDELECPCLGNNTCFQNALCYNTGSGGHSCAPCPGGYTGDGVTCTDIDECTEYRPCFEDRCINTDPGYQCLECPEGYKGTYEDAYSWVKHRRVFKYRNLELANLTYQTCVDTNECETNNGGCSPTRTCTNTIGSFYCSYCQSGYITVNRTECVSENYCGSGNYSCSLEAGCKYIGPAQYKCICKTGYAGDGKICVTDSDLDGIPDSDLPCEGRYCKQDNCQNVPNSMQEDADEDGLGDNCDPDDDNDFILDSQDNCVTVPNFGQLDTDGDSYGDACDTCISDSNKDQRDSDGDGEGDYCDSDDDDDGLEDGEDNCHLVYNPRQEESDGDGVGDICDNCPKDKNRYQKDKTHNWLGEKCNSNYNWKIEDDGDAALNWFDNCRFIINGDQSDIDKDGLGDACDDDIDGDGIPNDEDNCPYASNQDQVDDNLDTVGDACETDFDGDGVINQDDNCPNNPSISTSDFQDYVQVDIIGEFDKPDYHVHGDEIVQSKSTKRPSMLIGRHVYGDIEYQGTWYVLNDTGIDFISCVFGYASSAEYYTVMWKRTPSNYGKEYDKWEGGMQGLHIKLSDSWRGVHEKMSRALWSTHHEWWNSFDIWHDPNMIAWEPETAYRWRVIFKPSIGYMNVIVYDGSGVLIDSGPIYHTFLTGGHVGVLQYGKFPMIWSNLKVTCLEEANRALYFDGVDDFVTLDDVKYLYMEQSFAIEVWIKLDISFTSGPYPIVCSDNGDICLWVENDMIYGNYGNHTTSTDPLSSGEWYNVIYRYNVAGTEGTVKSLTRGSREDLENCCPRPTAEGNSSQGLPCYRSRDNGLTVPENDIQRTVTMQIGKGPRGYYRGMIDEVRLYNVTLTDKLVEKKVRKLTLEEEVKMRSVVLYFRMDDMPPLTTLVNTGCLTSATATVHGAQSIRSTQKSRQHKLTYPTSYYSYNWKWLTKW